jgi:phage I-like protein
MAKKIAPIKKKTKEQIMQANLRKVMRRLKTTVADREELWLEFFQESMSNILGAQGETTLLDQVVHRASSIADMMLDAYEERWGKG